MTKASSYQRPEPVADHGGSLQAARAAFPNAPLPWIDLSTGINPHSYPHSPLPATAFSRLPEPMDEERLREVAAQAYGADSAANIAGAPGTQILLPMVFGLARRGRAAVLSPTYAEHARAARLVGHDVTETARPDDLADADLGVIVNPNNPDGRIVPLRQIREIAARMAGRGGLLVVDEAFMDLGPGEESASREVEERPIVVLRSFGKFYGLAGVRLGFAIASRERAARLRDLLGPWAVPGPALAIGQVALGDEPWRTHMRQRLDRESRRLDDLILKTGLTACGTSLYRFIRHPVADALHRRLGEAGIHARGFRALPGALRLGLPGDEAAWARLEDALDSWTRTRE